MRLALIIAAAAVFTFGGQPHEARAAEAAVTSLAQGSELSAQSRRTRRTRSKRITVRPLRYADSPPGYGTDADLSRWKRDCVAVFDERNMPQWGGRVLYAGQRCRWVRQ